MTGSKIQKKILSLGAGVQSSAVLLMSEVGDLPKLDCAIFADTQWEPKAVYDHLDWLEANVSIPIHRVTAGDLRADALESEMRGTKSQGKRWMSMPLFTLSPEGKAGIIRRQCTAEYKIQPITKKLREILGYKPRQRIPVGSLEQWFGISSDEVYRMRDAKDRWITNYYPLVLGPKPYTRQGCHVWMEERGFPKPARSACIGCPFHSDAEWRTIKQDPEAWADAISFDENIRNRGGVRGKMFLHNSCVPLKEADLRSLEDRGQGNWLNECEGMCGV